jgi:SAM-dependent methyltransferase
LEPIQPIDPASFRHSTATDRQKDTAMYGKSIEFYDSLYHFKNYDLEHERLLAFIDAHHPTARSLLDVACGTGKHLERLTHRFDTAGVDLNPEFLVIARQRLPGVPFHQGNMIDFDLGKAFDIVTCLFSSVTYVLTAENMARTVMNLGRHVTPGGLLLIEPLFPPENYWVGRVTMNTVDEPDLKIAWMYVSELVRGFARLHYHFMVGTPDGIETFEEVHDLGLFTDAEYRAAFDAAGFDVIYDKVGLMNRGLYIGKRRG